MGYFFLDRGESGPKRGDNIPKPQPSISVREAPGIPELSVDRVLSPIPLSTAQPLLDAMLATSAGDLIDQRMAARREIGQIPLPGHGDRPAARRANALGLAANNRGDSAVAVTAFLQGVQADPADVELIDNLSLALYLIAKPAEARMAALSALTLAPERTSAWANLAQALADLGEGAKAVSAFRLAHYFSRDPQKTIAFIDKLSRDSPSAQVREAAGSAFVVLSGAPAAETTAPQTSAQAPAAAAPTTATAVLAPNNALPDPLSKSSAPPARTTDAPDRRSDPAPSTDPWRAAPQALPQAAQQMPQAMAIAVGMVEDGEAALSAKDYSGAITSARNALRVDPGNVHAQTLLRRADAAQRQAMDGITIK